MSTDIVEAGSALEPQIHAFFDTKTSCDVDGTMIYFAPDAPTYIDATLGWVFDSHGALRSVFEQYMPNWGPPARSYATRVLANETSALVHMVDTPELFGGELRVLAAIDLEDGKIVRWVDYWDASAYDPGAVCPVPDAGGAASRATCGRFPRRVRRSSSRWRRSSRPRSREGTQRQQQRSCTPMSSSWTWRSGPT